VKITASMLVPEHIRDDDAFIRRCPKCGERTFHAPQRVMVMSASGARSMRLWACEAHPLPDFVTDTPDES